MRAAATAVAILLASTAAADARPASTGWYTEGGMGLETMLGEHANYSAIGPSFDLRFGRDLFSWLSLGAHLNTTSHEATVPPPPEGEYYQLYSANAEARLGFRYKWFAMFVDGGIGLAMISSNILNKVEVTDPGESFTIRFAAGGGIEYQLQNRHYALGLGGQWVLLPEFSAMNGVTARAYLRYTY
jgi:opacity protein-like surface antigen